MRFQLQTGARVALRSAAPLAAGVIAAGVLYGDPLVILAPAVTLLFLPSPSVGSAIACFTALALTQRILAPRMTGGLDGWIRHLPADGLVHRRAISLGFQAAALPVILYLVAAGGLSLFSQPDFAGLKIAAIPVVSWAASLSVLRVRPWSRMIAAAAGVLSFVGTPWTFLVGVTCLVVSDLGAGPVRPPAQQSAKRRLGTGTTMWSVIWAKITFRALGFRFLGTPLYSALVLVPLAFFLSNNTLSPYQESLSIRFAGALAGILVLSIGADSMVVRRPPWPWWRSLAVSSGNRVVIDALILGASVIPAVIVAGALDLKSVPVVLGIMPWCALRTVSEIRRAPGQTASASARILLEGGLIVVAVAVLPWASLVVFAMTPLAFRTAIRDEINQDVSKWHELHHLAAGDSLSWSNQ